MVNGKFLPTFSVMANGSNFSHLTTFKVIYICEIWTVFLLSCQMINIHIAKLEHYGCNDNPRLEHYGLEWQPWLEYHG